VAVAVAENENSAASSRRGVRATGRLAAAGLAVAVAGAGVWGLSQATAPKPAPSAQDVPALSVRAAPVQPGSAVPADVRVTANATPVSDSPGVSAASSSAPSSSHQSSEAGSVSSLRQWSDRVAEATGIPVRALRAYGRAALAMRQTAPGCHLSWATLAGIGRVESDHGRYGGAVILPGGDESKPIVGVPLDGSGNVAAIGDSDGGALDGDVAHDRAVGPMQFIPSTWRKYASDGNGDGKGNPENVDDAALGAAHYLCVAGRDMATPAGWWSGLMSYNNSVAYGQKVFGLADTYAQEAKAALS
jgi:membrane-bound lytic murein transglycosylase B